MNILVNNNFAHRLTQGGLVHSAPVMEINGGGYVIAGLWQQRDLKEMSLTDGEMETIRVELDSLQYRLPRLVEPLPVVMPKLAPQEYNADAPVL